jgi:ElaB/YqjD/DUF883 family membrane-anchored ribosome-binding protein
MEQKTTTPEPTPTMEETPTSMTGKMELLEDRVRETVEGTRSAVEHIVDNVKGTADETVGAMKGTINEAKSTVDNLIENVKDTMESTVTRARQSFDLQYQVAQRPWATFGGAVVAGYFVGAWTQQGSRRQHQYRDQEHQYDDDDNLYAATVMSGGATVEDLEKHKNPQKDGYAYPPHLSSAAQEHTGNTAQEQPNRRRQMMGGQFQEEWNILRDVALGTLMGTIRAMVRQQMPTFAPHIEKILNRTSAKLGTEPIDPVHVQEPSQVNKTWHPAENPTAKTLPTEEIQESTSAIRGTPIESPSLAAQPRPYTQYRR